MRDANCNLSRVCWNLFLTFWNLSITSYLYLTASVFLYLDKWWHLTVYFILFYFTCCCFHKLLFSIDQVSETIGLKWYYNTWKNKCSPLEVYTERNSFCLSPSQRCQGGAWICVLTYLHHGPSLWEKLATCFDSCLLVIGLYIYIFY